MAFGRSNSLQINTGASNSLFGNTSASQPPPPAGGLFGNTATSQPSQTGGLFGHVGTSQPTQTPPLFGSTATSQPQQTSSLFGNTTTNAQPNTGPFGASLGQPSQPQQSSNPTGLFGSINTNRPSSSLFNTTNNATQATSSFGGGGGLFSTTNQQQQQPSTSMFGTSQQQQQQQQQQQPLNSTFMGMTAAPAGSGQPISMLGASQYRSNQQGSFQGRLTLGQTTANPSSTTGGNPSTQPNTAPGAVKVNYDTLKSTTRYADLIPDVAQALERIDDMIQAQERFAREIEAFIPKHGQGIASLTPDVELVSEKTDAVETALAVDAQAVEQEKTVLQTDGLTGQRLQRVVDNLRQPSPYHTRGADAGSKDLDLIGHFFRPLAGEMEQTLKVYASAIAEIEGHLGVLEQSAGGQFGGVRGSGVGSVRELAETLGAFEEGILGAAGMVGGCREGVDELVLGGGYGRR